MNGSNKNISLITSLYSGTGWKSIFSKARFWYAPFLEVEKLVPKNGVVIDLGCGEGIFTNFLGISSSKRKVLGIEIDQKRLSLASKGIKNVSFKFGDITSVNLPSSDTIILFHVLHHLHTYKNQEKVIEKCVKSLKKNGKILIVEIYICRSIQFAFSWIVDHFFVAWLFEKRVYSPILFRKINNWLEILDEKGLSCKAIFPNQTFKPFSNVIIECKKNEIIKI